MLFINNSKWITDISLISKESVIPFINNVSAVTPPVTTWNVLFEDDSTFLFEDGTIMQFEDAE